LSGNDQSEFSECVLDLWNQEASQLRECISDCVLEWFFRPWLISSTLNDLGAYQRPATQSRDMKAGCPLWTGRAVISPISTQFLIGATSRQSPDSDRAQKQ
jgi:hypothetical protein